MLVSPFKAYRLPAIYAKQLDEMDHCVTSSIRAEGFMSGLRGGVVSPDIAYCTSLSHLDYEPKMDHRELRLIGTDGVAVTYRASARLFFAFIDDYLEAFPEEESVSIPFTVTEMRIAMSISAESCKLVDCYNVLRYLNPKRTTHFLSFNLEGMKQEDLLEITAQLTVEERREIREARRLLSYDSLPREGEGIGILAHALEHHANDELLLALFSDCPCYLYHAFHELNMLHRVNDLLRTADFSNELPHFTHGYIEDLHTNLVESRTKEDAKRFLTLLGVTHKIFQNEGDYIAAPTDASYNIRPFMMTETNILHLSSLFGTTTEVTSATLDEMLGE